MQGGTVRRADTLVARFARIGSLPSDTPEEALRRQTLVLSAGTITAVATVWVITYWMLGLRLAATIPFAYQVISVANLTMFARTKRYRFFRACELGLSLLLPLLLQLALGGFVSSSGVILWSFAAPLGALLFADRRSALRWFAAFVVILVTAGLLDPLVVEARTDVPPRGVVVVFFVLNVLGVTGTTYFLLHRFVRERDAMAALVEEERQRSEALLLNVLPEAIAARLKSGESVIADRAAEVGVLFADIAGFTPLSERMPPEDVVRLLDEVFTAFDELAEQRGLEKIKTIGDAYMVASGLPQTRASTPEDLADMALAMQAEMERFPTLELRIGIDVGPVVAGVIGRSKFIYDLWGDTVNAASRMESHGIARAIQVTERAYERLADAFEFDERGVVDVKGKGPVRTYLLTASKTAAGQRAPAG